VEFSMLGADEVMLCSDRAEIVARRAVAGEEQMIAVVDRHPDAGIVVRAAASAGEARRLVNDHAGAGLRQPQGRGQAGKSGADDVDRPQHQTSASRNRIQASRPRETWTGSRGSVHPRSTRSLRMW